jgi:hypothetical protein
MRVIDFDSESKCDILSVSKLPHCFQCYGNVDTNFYLSLIEQNCYFIEWRSEDIKSTQFRPWDTVSLYFREICNGNLDYRYDSWRYSWIGVFAPLLRVGFQHPWPNNNSIQSRSGWLSLLYTSQQQIFHNKTCAIRLRNRFFICISNKTSITLQFHSITIEIIWIARKS